MVVGILEIFSMTGSTIFSMAVLLKIQVAGKGVREPIDYKIDKDLNK